MFSFSLLLVVISAVNRYTRNLIIPGVTILMLLGAILAVVPLVKLDVDEFYGIIGAFSDIIFYVFFLSWSLTLDAN